MWTLVHCDRCIFFGRAYRVPKENLTLFWEIQSVCSQWACQNFLTSSRFPLRNLALETSTVVAVSVFFQQHLTSSFGFKSRYPRLHPPGGVNFLLLKKGKADRDFESVAPERRRPTE